MNYFELYDLPVSLNVDEQLVKRKFYELSKKYHPDFYINESEDKRQEILERSTLNNKAYQVLSNFRKRISYVLELHGLLIEGEKQQIPQEFLMEMMEINEALMELEFGADSSQIQKISLQIATIEQSLEKDLEHLSVQFDGADEDAKTLILNKIKDIWYRQKYLLRIKEKITSF